MGRVSLMLASLLWLVQAGSGAEAAELALDHPSGFYESAFSLAIHAPTEGATVCYTTNGVFPRPVNALRCTRPIRITATTIVRAAAYDQQTNLIVTASASYLFVSDILRQTGASFPNTWGTNRGQPVPAHYGMTTGREENAASRQAVAEGLRSLATLSIIAEPADLFSSDGGIYAHPTERGPAWERAVSVELIDTNNRPLFQCDAGLRIHGSMSRRPEESPKHSFRLSFKSRQASGTFWFPLFGSSGAQEFETLVLRAGNNNSWLDSSGESRQRADYIRDEWMRRSMSAMGHPSARGMFVHLYLNGLYWGLYNLCEQPGDEHFYRRETDPAVRFDVRKGSETKAGDDLAWTEMMALANAGLAVPARYDEIGRSLDLPKLAEYLILNFYAGNSDWDRSANWLAVRPRTANGRFQFLTWDAECILEDLDANTLALDDDQSPMRLFHQLSENAEFRKLFARRARRLLSDDGPLSPVNCAHRYHRLADSVVKAMHAEAGRWGTYRRDVHQYKTGPFVALTVEEHWQREVGRLLTKYFPQRRAIVLEQFRERGLFPDASVPPSL